MGVPAFFRWLSTRYPKAVIFALSEDELEYMHEQYRQEHHRGGDPNEIDLDGEENDFTALTQRKIQQKIRENNPEFDNLYLDMNGIIHPCTRASAPGQPEPNTLEEMFNNIFEYVDKVMRIVKPQRIIYMAIDGVAPRAKMNQQRSRRFRGALEVEEQQAREVAIHSQWIKEGVKFSDATLGRAGEKFDKNVITPGTEFMYKLSKSLQHYLIERLHNDPLWKGLKIIFSDASVPGEGEHKILDFIRSQRAQPGYDPNTRHCIYGADADLIMLGLSTHEPHFCVIRETFIMDNDKFCEKCKEKGHLINECPTLKKSGVDESKKISLTKTVSFQFIKLNVVREYLQFEFGDLLLPFPYDLERIIDDFVFFCFFVGNDFLPHSPSLHIREGAIDAIMALYKHQLPALGDYLTNKGQIDFNRVDLILSDLAKVEEEMIKSKKAYEDMCKARDASGGRQRLVRCDQPASETQHIYPEEKKGTDNEESADTQSKRVVKELVEQQGNLTEEELNKLAAKKMKDVIKNMLEDQSKKRADKYVDKVRLGEDGWKARYYSDKFHVPQDELHEFLPIIKRYYLEGLQWVYSYYYNGCASWTWFYPFHYAPFAGDLVGITHIDIKFELGEPAQPFEQLMGVFPKQSAHAVPLCYRNLMSDPQSEIIDFYPTNFHIDINGARYEWMGVVLLPFIDRKRLLHAMNKADRNREALSSHEKELNKFGKVYIFFENEARAESRLTQTLVEYHNTTQKDGGLSTDISFFASFGLKDDLSGTVSIFSESISLGQKIENPNPRLSLQSVEKNNVFQLYFDHSTYEIHLSKLLTDIVHPIRQLDDFVVINRRFFNGERAIKMLEQNLRFESSISKNSRSYGGYLNNRAIMYEGARERPVENIIGKRRDRDYNSQSQQSQEEPHHRSRQDYQQRDQQNDYSQNQRDDISYQSGNNGYQGGGWLSQYGGAQQQQQYGGGYQQQSYNGQDTNYGGGYQQPPVINYNIHNSRQQGYIPTQHPPQYVPQQIPHQQANTGLYQPTPVDPSQALHMLIQQLSSQNQRLQSQQGNGNNQNRPQNRFHGFNNQ